MQHLSHPDLALLVGDLYQRAGLGLPPGEDLGEPGGWLDFDFYEAVPVE